LQKGYKLVSQKDDAKGERKFGLMLSKVHTVDFGTINDVVLELFDLAGECSGDYDGWETSVEKGE
jgi:regulator of RNase E activity RraB